MKFILKATATAGLAMSFLSHSAFAQTSPSDWSGQPLPTASSTAGGAAYNQGSLQSGVQSAYPECFSSGSSNISNSPCTPAQVAAGDSNQYAVTHASTYTPVSALPAGVTGTGAVGGVNVEALYPDSSSPTGVSSINAFVPLSDFATASSVASLGSSVTATNKQIASALGGGASVNANGQLTAPSYVIQGATYNNVGSALTAEDTAVTSLATSVSALSTNLGNLSTRLNGLQQFAYDSRTEARQGIAGAMAMSSASMPSAPGRTSWVVNVAEFRDQEAVGASFAHRFPTSFPLAMTAGFAVSGSRDSGARLGLAGEF